MSDELLDDTAIAAADLADWRRIGNALHTRFRTGDFATGLRLVNQIGEAAEAANHHPDLDLRYPHLNIRLSSHDKGGITDRDVALARQISEFAAAAGVKAEPSAASVLEVVLDTPDHDQVKPFWRAILGYGDNPRSADELLDGAGSNPTMWFQKSGADEPRQRFHIDIRVPADVVEQRVAEAVAAGGTIVHRAKTFIHLADAEGNACCVCQC